MHIIDLLEFIVYMLAMIGIGYYFLKKNKSIDDYYVGGRQMGSWHIGLSVVATDVGGGFSIGLGGLGFVMGISGSWMLFTGLIGAWLSAVFLIPRIHRLPVFKKLFTFPQIFAHFYGARVALAAGIISAIGYIGFTSSQILAGAKLASATFINLDMTTALLLMGGIVMVYTAIGGIKAVIYTDTIQWIILMSGLIFIGLPMAWVATGEMDLSQIWNFGSTNSTLVNSEAINETITTSEKIVQLPPEMLSLRNLTWQTMVNWAFTIIPIWFVGMTLYQRIFACRDEKTAKKAWFIAGVFEWPLMAFMGVMLGLFARMGAEQGMFAYLGYSSAVEMDPEMGLPLLLRSILPVGLLGLMMSAYFSAIMSTADSCLMAASGNVASDIIDKIFHISGNKKRFLQMSQWLTLFLGMLALILATGMQNVLELMLYSYAFMVSGLLVPIIGALFWKKSSSVAAFWAMVSGGSTTLILIALNTSLPYELDANIFGIAVSLICFVTLTLMFPKKNIQTNEQ